MPSAKNVWRRSVLWCRAVSQTSEEVACSVGGPDQGQVSSTLPPSPALAIVDEWRVSFDVCD
eukprot:5614041-Pleurochrysis_carterae.AAC.1